MPSQIDDLLLRWRRNGYLEAAGSRVSYSRFATRAAERGVLAVRPPKPTGRVE